MRSTVMTAIGVVLVLLLAGPARAETPEQWVAPGTRVHGGSGTFIPVGIRIGEDALHRLGVGRRLCRLPELLQSNKAFDPLGRYKAVMDAPEPFQVTEAAAVAGGR